MPVRRVPILVWEDVSGGWTARAVEDFAGLGMPAAAAYAATPEKAVDEARRYLAWILKRDPTQTVYELEDPKLELFRVAVEPSAPDDRESAAAGGLIEVSVTAVVGSRRNGLRICALPLLGAVFSFREDADLKDLVGRRAQSALGGLSTRQLLRRLPPRRAYIETVTLTLPRPRAAGIEARAPVLSLVADLAGGRSPSGRIITAFGRDREVEDLCRRLTQENANVLVLGEAGAGKTAVLEAAARRFAKAEVVPEGEPRTTLWRTSADRLIAGMKYLGEWEERCERVIGELASVRGVLAVERLLDLVRVGGAGPGDSLASFFLPYLQQGELRMVVEAAPSELDACRRLLPGFADVFQVLKLEPFDGAAAESVLEKLSLTLAENHGAAVEDGLPGHVLRLHKRFFPYEAFPGKAAEFLYDLVERSSRRQPPIVSVESAAQRFVERSGLPALFLRDDAPLRREEVIEWLRARVIGQDGACRAVADAVTLFKSGMNDPRRPLAVFLFAGPTGVGKTQLAKELARYLFGHGEETDRLLRLDMSEYSGPGAAERLLEEDDGRPSGWIARVRRQPFTLVLLDEIEKAAPDVFDLLLGLLDEGRLTDRFGRVATFRSAAVVMTSNLGVRSGDAIGFDPDAVPSFEAEVRSFFRPEFFNRLDAVVPFAPLSVATIHAIARKELRELESREGVAGAGVRIEWTDQLVARVAVAGFDARYGARPLQRAIESLVVTPLGRFLLEHSEAAGRTIRVDVDDEGRARFDAG